MGLPPLAKGSRVSAQRGALLAKVGGERRARRLRLFGDIVDVRGEHSWVVRWDSGETEEVRTRACQRLFWRGLCNGKRTPPPRCCPPAGGRL